MEEGQANPEESQRIRKALLDLPAVEVKSIGDAPRQLAFVPHATLVGWISEKEILIIEDHVLVVYTLGTGARRKSSVRVEDAGRVFLARAVRNSVKNLTINHKRVITTL